MKGGLILVSLGILAGMMMSLFAFEPSISIGNSFVDYKGLPRRLLRLSHISLIMLPLLNIVLGPFIGRLRMQVGTRIKASRSLLVGAVVLPLSLAAAAFFSPANALYIATLPAMIFASGIFVVSVGAWRTPAMVLLYGEPEGCLRDSSPKYRSSTRKPSAPTETGSCSPRSE